ncbi:hypothetical protein TNCV_3348831 [Trichonephila clavipes]|nr:hypothetical protein TNCV_3348831 [Trichonephila clavipes]
MNFSPYGISSVNHNVATLGSNEPCGSPWSWSKGQTWFVPCGSPLVKNVLDESRSFFRVHTGYFSNIPKCIKAEFIASWACSQSSVVSSSQR